ncbi:hypothetical protein KPY62_09170 [Psychrobacter sp. TAE2020]|uniref:hypothetical protein n=1 Tax=Psychrobacter sp. TAE2020 TaxID=2846762 RepID=UPI001C123702|nr:hypothetical protein [Psychrobacter sp. TAE2020]MBU5617253.1 hypothetical protein [Psychrobacter sp. TAE2020]
MIITYRQQQLVSLGLNDAEHHEPHWQHLAQQLHFLQVAELLQSHLAQLQLPSLLCCTE